VDPVTDPIYFLKLFECRESKPRPHDLDADHLANGMAFGVNNNMDM
jgi:hypothetical protein